MEEDQGMWEGLVSISVFFFTRRERMGLGRLNAGGMNVSMR